MVNGCEPTAGAGPAVIVSFADSVLVIVDGWKTPVAPAGRPLKFRATVPANPPDGVTATV
jgi:hypothetical protein